MKKNVSFKFFMLITLITFATGFMACSSDDDEAASGYPITVTYKVTTTNGSNISTIAYYNGNGGTNTEQNVASGWTKEVTVNSVYPTMSVAAAAGTKLKGEIIRDGKVVAEAEGTTVISVSYTSW